jgi:hypothetical protein
VRPPSGILLMLLIAPPFHPAGQASRAVCPVCVNRQNNRTLKQMYAIGGFTKGQYDSEIPHHFFQCPPVALDTKESGMDALRVCCQTRGRAWRFY